MRGREVFAKVEPSFILGGSREGKKFRQLAEKDQLVYLRLWCHAIECRESCFQNNGESFKELSQKIGKRSDKLSGFFQTLIDKELMSKLSDGRYKLFGVREKHIGLKWKDAPNRDRLRPK